MIDWWMARCSNSIHEVKGLITPFFCDCLGTSIGCLKVKIKGHQKMVNNELTSNLMLSKSKFCYTIPSSSRYKELALDQGGIIDYV
jgi:hypothetical protein